MKTTIIDIAKIAGVSVGTASMAINNKPGISEATRQKILEVASRLNYTPNQNARSLITKKSNTIGLVVTDVTNPFFGMLVNEINNAVISKGYNLLLGVSNDTIENEKRSIDTFLGQRVEGVIIVPCVQKEHDISHIYNLKTNNVPFVFATTAYPGVDADCIMTDLARGSYLLTKHLLDRGHTRIFLVSGYRELILSSLRIRGYREAFKEKNLNYSEDWVIETIPNFEHGYEVTERILAEKPDAIITINDVLALGVIKCLKENKIRVPEDISVGGYDDLLYTSILETPLTTIRQPITEIANGSVEMLLRRLDGDKSPCETLYVEPILKVRATTR